MTEPGDINGRKHSSRTNVLKFQEIDRKLDGLHNDIKLIKTELLGDESWRREGMISEHRKNTLHRKVTTKIWVGVWVLIPTFLFVFATEVKAFITLITSQ